MTDIYNQNDLLGVDRPSMTSLLFCKLIHRSSRPPGDLYDLCFLYVTTLVAIVTAAACLCVCALPVCVLTNPPPLISGSASLYLLILFFPYLCENRL